MHILFFMAIATVLIITWFTGNLFACVFLSLVPGVFLLLCVVELFAGSMSGVTGIWAFACIGLLVAIWAPRHFRLQAMAPRRD